MSKVVVNKQDIGMSSVSFCLNVKTKEEIISFYIRSKTDSKKLDICLDGWNDMVETEKALSIIRGFMTDKSNYEIFDKIINNSLRLLMGSRYLDNVAKTCNKFLSLLREKMKMEVVTLL